MLPPEGAWECVGKFQGSASDYGTTDSHRLRPGVLSTPQCTGKSREMKNDCVQNADSIPTERHCGFGGSKSSSKPAWEAVTIRLL